MDIFRKNLNKYSRKAFNIIPKINKPDILDIGCGSGVCIIELARLTDGKIVAIDIDEVQLEKLSAKLKELFLEDRVKVLNCSMFNMDFPNESFDIIWAEGSIYAIGFNNGLKNWMRFLKPNGYLVVHDEKERVSKKIKDIAKNEYQLINHFILSKKIWWNEYYKPIEEHIKKLLMNPGFQLEEEHLKNLKEIEMCKKYPEKCRSVFF